MVCGGIDEERNPFCLFGGRVGSGYGDEGLFFMTHLEYLYSQKVSIRDESDLKFVVERTDRVVVLQVPFLDTIGVRAYIPKEKMDKVKELLLSFKKTGSKKPSISPEEDVKFVNDFVCSMQFFDRKGLVIGVLGYYYPNRKTGPFGARLGIRNWMQS